MTRRDILFVAMLLIAALFSVYILDIDIFGRKKYVEETDDTNISDSSMIVIEDTQTETENESVEGTSYKPYTTSKKYESIEVFVLQPNKTPDPVLDGKWQLVWQDTFKEPAINYEWWTKMERRDSYNRELQYYSVYNTYAKNGMLHIMQGYDIDYLTGRFCKKRSLLVNLQIVEYMKGFYVYKKSLAKQNATATISGAFGVFTRDILMKAGGFRRTLGEDIDITLCIQRMIHKTDKKLVYLTEAMCYTQCPENLYDLTRQRMRWQKGFVSCVLYNKKFLFRTLLTKSLSFHFLLEAMIIGICSCLFTVFMYVFVPAMAFSDISILALFGIYYGFGVVFNIAYSLTDASVLKEAQISKSSLKESNDGYIA